MSDWSGQSLRGYALRERIGAGAFGEVYRARQQAIFDREVALKVIAPQYANQPSFIRDFESEAQLVSQLEHPHIVPLLDFWREPDSAYLVMRLLRGGSLKERIEDHALSTDETLKLLEQVGGGLAHAHQQQVVHRDLKPANILLDEGGNAYLADFGLALVISGEEQKHDGVEGTLMYMSPEQLMDEALSPCSDLFSLGLLLYEVLTGEHPFASSSSQVEMLTKLMNEPLPPLSEQCPDLPQALNEVIQTATAKQPAERYSEASELVTAFRAALGLATPVVIAEADIYNPYKGLRAFSEADAGDFFGREALVQHLLERMAEDDPAARFLALVGPSGGGKSSAVQAGLIPALRKGRLPGSEDWYIARMRPDRQPFQALAQALLGVAAKDYPDLVDFLAEKPEHLLTAVKEILSDDAELLLFIDQFEELFTLTGDEDLRAAFLESLYAAVTSPNSPLRVIVALRADFYDRPLGYPGFAELMRARQETILPLSASELEAAIVGPARKLGITFEDGLAPAIIDDIGHEPGALPLLQYALTRLFDERDGRTLTHAAYRAMGGVSGALAGRAEQVFIELDPPEQAAARQVFLRLVEPGEGQQDTRQRVALSTLAELGVPAHIQEVLEAFDRHRLLTFDRDPESREPVVELAHEALLRQWGRLRGWIDESRSEIHLRQELTGAAQDWVKAGQETSYLLPGGARLEALAEWAQSTEMVLTPDEREFLVASLSAEAERQAREARLEQRARRVLQILVGVFLVAALVSGWLAVRARNSEQAALRQASIGLAAQSRLETVEGRPDRAALVAFEALTKYPYTWQAERALFAAVHNNRLHGVLTGQSDMSFWIDYSPDGTKVAAANIDGSVMIWDTNSGDRIAVLSHEIWVNRVYWSPDGTRVVTASDDGLARIWDPTTGEEILRLVGHDDFVQDADWSPDGTMLATGSGDGTMRLWDAATGQEQMVLTGHEDLIFDIEWSPDGKKLASGSFDGTARIWNPATGDEIWLLDSHTGPVRVVPWSPDGSLILTTSGDGTAIVWNSATGEETVILPGEGLGGISWAYWSPDGERILTVENGRNTVDGAATIWNATTGEKELTLPGIGDLGQAAWSPDGLRVAVADETIFTRIWDTTTGEELFVLRFPPFIYPVAWSPNGDQIAVGYRSGEVLLWDMTPNELFISQAAAIGLSPDGELLVHDDASGELVVSDLDTGEIVQSLGVDADLYLAARWSPDGEYIAGARSDWTIQVWNSTSGEETAAFHVENAYDPWWSPDSTRIATTNFGTGDVFVHDAATGDIILTIPSPTVTNVCGVAWSPDGTRLAFGDSLADDTKVQIIDTATGQILLTIPTESGICVLSWSPDGTRLAVPLISGTVEIIDAETAELLLTFAGHTGPPLHADWSPDGTRLATVGDDGVRIWDPITGSEYGLIEDGGGGPRVFWSSDGNSILVSHWDGTSRLWRVFPDTESLIEYARACCVLRSLPPSERELFGLPPVDEQMTDLEAHRNHTSPFAASFAVFGLAPVGLGFATKRINRQ